MPRRKRFIRTEAIPMQLMPRDVAILDVVARHRFLNSRQIADVIGGSLQHLLRRLQKLFLGGYLNRPRAQIDYFHAGMRPMIYELGRVGRRALTDANGTLATRKEPTGRYYIEHTLLVAAVSLAFGRSGKGGLGHLLSPRESLPHSRWPDRWSVSLRHGGKNRVGVCPDLTLAATDAKGQRVLLFIEADRGTMPIVRRSLGQSSFMRKLRAYEATWTQHLTKQSHGIERFRVLTVTRTVARAERLAEACAQLDGGRGLFLFTDIAALESSSDAFVHEWVSGHGGRDRIFGL
jgi:DNA-binding Lrp family transcriptional regulator